MGAWATIGIIILSISFIVFVIFFGRLPALRNTLIGSLHRLLTTTLPTTLVTLDSRLTSGRLTPFITNLYRSLALGRHPIVLLFFLALLTIGTLLFLPPAWPHLTTLHRITGPISIFAPYLFLYLSAATDPGFITPPNLPGHLSLYPYDYTIFHPGQSCRTCNLLKPARSKHCAVCNRCVAKNDHHCIFINNCVGYANHAHFLLLLLSTAVLTTYAACVGTSIMQTKITARFDANWLWYKWTSGLGWQAWLTGWGYGLQTSVEMGSVTLLTIMISPMVWGLFGYQLYLVYAGTTTNETMKWSDWTYEMDLGCAYKRPLPPNRSKNPSVESVRPRWPLEPQQIVVRTDDGTPPAPGQGLPGTGQWEKVSKLKDVENLYDLGFWDNLGDVFVRGYAFGKGADWGERLPGETNGGVVFRNGGGLFGKRKRRKSGRRKD